MSQRTTSKLVIVNVQGIRELHCGKNNDIFQKMKILNEGIPRNCIFV